MDLIITLIIVLSPTEYHLKQIPIKESCETWYEKNTYHDSKNNIHYIGDQITMGYICGSLMSK